MIIRKLELAWLRVPLITPFKTALRTVDAIHDLVVILHGDGGQRGFGSAPSTPLITGDTHASVIAAIEQVLVKVVVGRDIADLTLLCQQVQRAMPHNSSAKAALEIAMYDLAAQDMGLPLYKMLGGQHPQLTTDITISVDHQAKMLSDCQAALARGFTTLKIKVGRDSQQDLANILAIYALVDGRASLRLDVNQGWTEAQTIAHMQQLEAEGVELELVEQPVDYRDIEGMARICRAISTPVMADESAFSVGDVQRIIALQAADIINIKLMKTGGISQAIAIAELAHEHNLPCMMGCMLEGSIGVAAAAHLVSGYSDSISLIDLDGPTLGRFDPVLGGASFDNASIELSDQPGLGIEHIQGLEEFRCFE